MQLSSRTKGTCFLIFSAFSFAWMNAFVRLAGDLSFIQKSFFRNLIALLVALIMLFKERQPLHCDKKSAGALLLRATMGTVGIFCNFYAVDHLPMAAIKRANHLETSLHHLRCVYRQSVHHQADVLEPLTVSLLYWIAGRIRGRICLYHGTLLGHSPRSKGMDYLSILCLFLSGCSAVAAAAL